MVVAETRGGADVPDMHVRVCMHASVHTILALRVCCMGFSRFLQDEYSSIRHARAGGVCCR